MKIQSFTKKVVAVALLTGAAAGANAAVYNLGNVRQDVPTSFNALVTGSDFSFSDLFTFTLPTNGGSGYSVIDFPIPGLPGAAPLFHTLLTTATLFSNPDGVLGTGDEVALRTAVSTNNTLSLSWGPSAAGSYFLNVAGVTAGSAGGAYNGAISVTTVPEPESYAMFLAGLGIMGAIIRRRSRSIS
jgi:hypothetical protein